MKTRDLTQQDEELIAAAFEAIRSNYVEDRHGVGAAVRAASGKIYTRVNIESPGVGTCAEPVALGAAVTAGERQFQCVVAVERSGPGAERPGIMSPCGVCRELLYHYCPDADVIVPGRGGPGKLKASDLLPIPYTDNRKTETT
jgi:cytidine deaminase